MRKLVLIFYVLLSGIFGSYVMAACMENVARNVFRFAFSAGEDAYDNEYSDNAAEWQRLLVYYHSVRENTAGDGYYFLIESFIYNNVGDSDLPILNQATFRGNLIRSQLQVRLGVPSAAVAFCINRSGRVQDRVQVTLVREPMPAAVNKDIFFSLGNSRQDISKVFRRYPEIPYYDLYYYGQETRQAAASVTGTVSDTVSALASTPAPASVSASVPATGTARVILPETVRRPQAHPFNLGIKTNLIPWMGLVPSWSLGGGDMSGPGRGAMMYNGALEYYFSGCASVEFSFLYAYTSYGGRTDNLWGISQLTFEPRFWFRPDNRFRGWSAGLRLGYGDFDMRIRQPDKYGKTGRFYSAAFSLGYTLPVYRSLLVEGSVYGGYRNLYDGKDYRVDDGDRKNYFENGFAGGSWMVGVSLNLLFRIGFR